MHTQTQTYTHRQFGTNVDTNTQTSIKKHKSALLAVLKLFETEVMSVLCESEEAPAVWMWNSTQIMSCYKCEIAF